MSLSSTCLLPHLKCGTLTRIHQLILDLDFTLRCKRNYLLKIIFKFTHNSDFVHIFRNSYFLAKLIVKMTPMHENCPQTRIFPSP